MIRRRAAVAGRATKPGHLGLRATGITACLKNGGTLEKAAAMANQPRRGRADRDLSVAAAPWGRSNVSDPTPEKIMQVGLGFWPSKVLLSAIEMGLFTELAKKSGDLADLRSRLGLHARSAHDFLDALVALGFLQRDDGTYRNAPDTELFLDRGKPSYIGSILEMANQRLYPFWGHLTAALRTGLPQNEAKHGGNFFAALYADPARLTGFLHAMSGLSRPANIAIARQLPWKKYRTFVDLGTAQGDLAVQIARHNPHLVGLGYDLGPVGPIFTDYVAAHGLSERLRFVAGDFLADALPPADVVLMGHVLHDWSLDEKQVLIRKAYDALPPDGALVIYEAIIDDYRRNNTFGLLMSLNMLIETPAGFDYTGADCCGWMKAAGFRETHVEHLAGPDSMVIGIK
jgi:SAM-dependent methyltransferase